MVELETLIANELRNVSNNLDNLSNDGIKKIKLEVESMARDAAFDTENEQRTYEEFIENRL